MKSFITFSTLRSLPAALALLPTLALAAGEDVPNCFSDNKMKHGQFRISANVHSMTGPQVAALVSTASRMTQIGHFALLPNPAPNSTGYQLSFDVKTDFNEIMSRATYWKKQTVADLEEAASKTMKKVMALSPAISVSCVGLNEYTE